MKSIATHSCILLLCLSFHTIAASLPKQNKLAIEAVEMIDVDLDRAESLIEQALEVEPDNPLVNFVCGRVMGRQAGEAFFSALRYAKRALSCLKKAVELEPTNVVFRKGLINFYLGAPGIAGGDVEKAFEQVEQIKNLDIHEGLIAEVNAYRKTQQLDLLIAQLNTELMSHFSEYSAFQMGLVQLHLKNYSAAFTHFNKVIDNNESSRVVAESLYQIGKTAVLSQSNTQNGIHALNRYIELEKVQGMPSEHWAFYRLSQLYAQSGESAYSASFRLRASGTSDAELLRRLQKSD